jgi:hypothetical protein
MIHACLVEKETMKSLYKYKANMKAGPRRVRIVKVLSDGIVHLEILELNPRNFHRRGFFGQGSSDFATCGRPLGCSPALLYERCCAVPLRNFTHSDDHLRDPLPTQSLASHEALPFDTSQGVKHRSDEQHHSRSDQAGMSRE